MQIRGTWSAGPGDDQARFLSDLRALRDTAAIGYDELAARAHFPSDVLKEAENGPVLPSLPILTAYVRACDGDVPDWEERWRQLTSEIPEDPDLPVRPAGASAAAVAGARAGVGIAPPEVHDPERIKAALRGGLARSGNGGSGLARSGNGGSGLARSGNGGSGANRKAGTRSKAASGWGANPGWDAVSDETVTIANGNHSPASWSREPFDTSGEPDPVQDAEAADPFRWLPEEESVLSSPEGGSESANTESADPYSPDTRIATVGSDTGSDQSALTAPASIESAVTEWAPRWDDAGKPAEGTDFWSAAAAAPDTGTHTGTGLPRPAATAQPDESAYAQTSWSAAVARTEAAAARTEAAAARAEAVASARPAPAAPTPAPPATTSAAPATPAAPPPATTSAPPATRYPLASDPVPGIEAATATPPRTYAGSAGSTGSAAGSTVSPGSTPSQAPSHQARARQRDRLFPAQLLVIIVIAALIGSALVLLLK